jgi:hypothetical protein
MGGSRRDAHKKRGEPDNLGRKPLRQQLPQPGAGTTTSRQNIQHKQQRRKLMLDSRNSQKNNNFLLFHIFFISLSILSSFSGAESAPAPDDIKKMLVKYQTVLRSFQKFIPKNEYSYYDSIIQTGKPREVKIETP